MSGEQHALDVEQLVELCLRLVAQAEVTLGDRDELEAALVPFRPSAAALPAWWHEYVELRRDVLSQNWSLAGRFEKLSKTLVALAERERDR